MGDRYLCKHRWLAATKYQEQETVKPIKLTNHAQEQAIEIGTNEIATSASIALTGILTKSVVV